ncbi:RluA family pseudouridine synthase [Candidatus Uhrbacteria bacterium]|nr:RluA family pseudouridine synthase [Candidatus Uhrbacteria bacterium]
METLSVTVEDDVPERCRIDRYITDQLDLFSRSQLKLRARQVRVNGKSSKLSRPVQAGDIVEIDYELPETPELEPEPVDFQILYEDRYVIVVDKPQGLVVHPGEGHYHGTLVSGILHHCRSIADGFAPESVRPGIVHRLDKDTSGVIVVAKDARSHEYLSAQFRDRKVRKVYYAVLRGVPARRAGEVDLGIERDPNQRKRFRAVEGGGRPSLTRYRVLKRFTDHSLVRFVPRTGRTHQIRVHAVALGCPVLGDPIYARRDKRFPEATLMLHAYSLTIGLPPDGRSVRFCSGLPDRFCPWFDERVKDL